MGTGTCDCRHGASFRDCPFAFLVAYYVKASSDQSPFFPSFFQPRTPEESRLRSAFVEKKDVAKPHILLTAIPRHTANLRTKMLDIGGLDSNNFFISRDGIFMFIGNFLEILSPCILAGIILVGSLGARVFLTDVPHIGRETGRTQETAK